MAKALTAKAIEAMKPTATRQEIPDGGLPGLYLIIQPKRERHGKELPAAMSWAIRYRFDGRPKKHTIGSYPAYSLAQAREEGGKALRAVSEVRDPAAEKAARKERKLDLVEDAIDEFIKRHVEKENRPNTVRERKRLFEKEVKPKWRGRNMQTITRLEIIQFIDKTADRAPVLANRLLALLRKFFGWAVERDILEVSPMNKKIRPPGQETTRDRILTDDEIRLLLLAADKQGYPFGPMVRMLLLTGQRRSEVADAEWIEFELGGNNQLWVIPPERSKNRKEHFVPLPALLLSIIEALPRIKPSNDEKAKPVYLFTTSGTTPVSGFSKAKTLLDAAMLEIARKEAIERGDDPKAVTIEPWTFHDLRRTAASGMARLSVPVHVVEAVLNHRSGSIKGVAAVYNRYDYADEKRAALTAWAARIAELMPKP
ncbi:tyrosine-type recombinase/integrase [Neorhizobium sp. LjRoot104]|uniref:tyrosine-type recombinase/integrase n=1 Tax=Neorhizobium sp. LjRoot104 TaxID=3342254 RepID=UPI003ECC4F2C